MILNQPIQIIFMQDIERKAKASARAMVEKLQEDHKLAMKMKRDNELLRRKIQALMRNNQDMAAIVRKLDNKMDETKLLPKEKYVYSYQDKMMVREEEVDRKRLELKRKNANLGEINRQLSELLGIMKKRNININQTNNNE
jgi:hypothetical protein